jgi:hypothetical protein
MHENKQKYNKCMVISEYGQIFEGVQNFRYLACRNVIREDIKPRIAARNRCSIAKAILLQA